MHGGWRGLEKGICSVLVARKTISIDARLDLLLRQATVLQQILEEQHALAAGKVNAQESRRRLSVANRINEACQQLELDLVDTAHRDRWTSELAALRALAEAVLRENPILQARGPLHVIRSSDMPNRYVLNRTGGRELRKGFGLHRDIRNDAGPSVVVAFTPPGYEQMWHAHTVDEYTLALDVRFAGRYACGETHTLTAEDGELFHFHPHTYHTLANLGHRSGRTFTLKYPIGISIWLPALQLTGAERGAAEVWSVPPELVGDKAVMQRFQVRDSHHTYAVIIAHLRAGMRFDLKCEDDTYVYVLDGCVEARRGRQTATAAANDLIVSEPTRLLRVRALAACTRLYWASDIAEAPIPPSRSGLTGGRVA